MTTPTPSTIAYTDLALAEPLKRAVADMGYTHTTPIQAQAIPVVLAGQDVMGAAQTGTGKTAAFSLPLLHRLLPHENNSASPARHPVRALVLLPTRELADQVAQQICQFARHTQLRSAVVFGGVDIKPQAAELKQGVEILIATPGRLLDHLEARHLTLNQVEYVVLDEADRMLDIGFLPDLQRILGHLPQQRTTLLFSATFSPEIKRLAASYLQNPVTIEVAQSNTTAATVIQRFIQADDDQQKQAALVQLLRDNSISQAFIFCNSKLRCARLARTLERQGFQTSALHGDKSQDDRLKALDAFKQGQVQLLVCTDVAARGLDIKDVPAVFNFDIPFRAEDYVHRIGRTGRAGADGLAISLCTANDQKAITEIAKLTRQHIAPEALSITPPERHERRNKRIDRNYDRDKESPFHNTLASEFSRPRGERHYRPPARHNDPIFDTPYQPQSRTSLPIWEIPAPMRPTLYRGGITLSANIRPKRQVAALFLPPPPKAPTCVEADATTCLSTAPHMPAEHTDSAV